MSQDKANNTEKQNRIVNAELRTKTLHKRVFEDGEFKVSTDPKDAYTVELVELTLADSFKVFVQDLNTKLYVESTDNKIQLSLNEVKKLLGESSEILAVATSMPIRFMFLEEKYEKVPDKMLNDSFYVNTLTGSQVVLKSELVPAGTVIDGASASERDRWFNNVVAILPKPEAIEFAKKAKLF